VVYPMVRPSPKLAYSTLWRPNGRGLYSTPFKRSKDPLEYHSVLLSLYYIPLARNLHNLEPLAITKMFTKKHGMSNAHKTQNQSDNTHTSHNTSSQHNSKSALLKWSSSCHHKESNARI
jgi:hypothetical protein